MTVVGLVHGPDRHSRWRSRVAMVALSPMLSLSDAYALSGLGARGRSYGPVRLWGSVAFIAGNVGAGFLLEAIAPGHLIWLIVFALMLVVVAAALALTPLDAGPRPAAAAPRPVAEDSAAQSGVSRGGAGVEHGAGQPRALLRLLDHAMARRRPRRHRDRAAVGPRRGGRDRAVCAVGAAAEVAAARPRCWRSAASARSSAGPRWRSTRRRRCCRCCSSCTRPRSARRISA